MMKCLSNLSLVASIVALLAVPPLFAEDSPKKEAPKAEATKAEAKQAEDTKRDKPKLDTAKKHRPGRAILGVYVTSAHPALASNLGELLSPEQGLIVEDFLENSPAAEAGIKIHDILTTYDDQKLFSAEQLAKLVHTDQPGREVTIGLLRDGKLQTIQVALGESKLPRLRAWIHAPEATPHPRSGAPRLFRWLHPRHTPDSEWENFDSLSLKSLGDNKFRAEVQHVDKDKVGKIQKHVFEGTREEIRKAIENDKDLKPVDRAHLLRSLNLPHLTEDMLNSPDWFDDLPEHGF